MPIHKEFISNGLYFIKLIIIFLFLFFMIIGIDKILLIYVTGIEEQQIYTVDYIKN